MDFSKYLKEYPDKDGKFGSYGGAYLPEELVPAMKEIEQAYLTICHSSQFINELRRIRKEFQGRPTPVYHCERLSRMIGKNDAYDYPGVLIYAMAAYTFYAVILSIVGLIRFRRHGSPVLSGIKVVNFTAALTALLSLEATMLQRFSDADSDVFRARMLGISGLVASLILLSLSAYMIVHASRHLRVGEGEEM